MDAVDEPGASQIVMHGDGEHLRTFRGERSTNQTVGASEVIINLERVCDHGALLVLARAEGDVGLVGAQALRHIVEPAADICPDQVEDPFQRRNQHT